MLDWLAIRHGDARLHDAAQMIETAVSAVFLKHAVLPFEFGGRSGTAEIARAVIERLHDGHRRTA
jgi:3-isopropylmalate dehydrogenase